ncbi:type VI secretion system contractile sheath small subunit [Acidobacteriota bacterium]
MPQFNVERAKLAGSVRPVPTTTTAAVMPMTLDRVGKEVEDEEEEPTRIDSVDDAFKKFKPGIQFETTVGEEGTEIKADIEFTTLKDFSPENIQKKQPGKRNDLADLKNTIDLLYRMKDRWSIPKVKRAWKDPAQRKQIISALSKLRAELEKVAKTPAGGE